MKLVSADLLEAFMKQRSFTPARLARYAECHRSFIGYLLSGKKSTCSRQLAELIAEALDVPVTVLFVQHGSADRGRDVNSPRKKVAA
jgi:hypothetical protein